MAKKLKVGKAFKSVKGISTSEILKMDVYKLNTKGLRTMLNRIISSANKRIRRLEAKAPNSPALASYKRENKPFTSKGLSHNELETMFKRVKNFLQAETSTMKGYKAHREDIVERIGTFKNEKQEKKFWEIYNKWIETYPNLAVRFRDTNELQSMFYENFVIKGRKGIGNTSAITRAIKKMYGEVVANKNKEDMLNQDALLNDGVKQSDF